MDRRRYLLTVVGASAAIAGCTEQSTTESGTTSDDDAATDTSRATTEGDGTTTDSESTTETDSAGSTTEESGSGSDGVTGDGETGLDIRHVAGDQVTDEGITRIRLLATPATAGAVDLSGVTIEWSGEAGDATITHGSADGDASFTVRPVQDDDDTLAGDRPVLDGLADHADLTFEVPAAAGGPVEGGTEIDLAVRTAGGIESSGRIQTPTTLTGSPATLGGGIEAETEREGTVSRVAITSVTGSVVERSVQTVTATAQRASAEHEIDLSRVVLRYIDPSGVYDLSHESGGGDGQTFTTSPGPDDDGSHPVLDDDEDRFSIGIDLASVRGDDGLAEGEGATLLLMTPSGGTTTLRLVAPSSLPEDGEVAL